MSIPTPVDSGFFAAFSRFCLALVVSLTPCAALGAQEHDDDHDHDHLHFSHPVVTESPSPDTKLRFDYLGTRTSGLGGIHESIFRVEGEYGFNDNLSLAIVTPFVSRTAPQSERESGLGDIELSLKAASLAFGEQGLLIGGGLSAKLPTGSDTKGIGSSHLVKLEPFLDAGYKLERVELVGFATLSSTFNRRIGEAAERELAFDFSALTRVSSRIEGMIELTTARALVGTESGTQRTFLAPGLKIYPFPSRKVMLGASAEFGVGAVKTTRALLVSAFYHF